MSKFDVEDRGDLVRSRRHWQRDLSKLKRKRRTRHVRGQIHRAEAMLARRNRQLRALDRHHGARQACEYALSKVGTHEVPAFSNRGFLIDKWLGASSTPRGNPWCQAFVNACLVSAGLPQIHSDYTPFVLAAGRSGRLGLHSVSLRDLKPGDILYYKFPGVSHDTTDHVGIYVGGGRIVEGNTSPGRGGSQNNGGGVYIRSLAERRRFIVGVVRPNYHH